jgi:hypothetical protein
MKSSQLLAIGNMTGRKGRLHLRVRATIDAAI